MGRGDLDPKRARLLRLICGLRHLVHHVRITKLRWLLLHELRLLRKLWLLIHHIELLLALKCIVITGLLIHIVLVLHISSCVSKIGEVLLLHKILWYTLVENTMSVATVISIITMTLHYEVSAQHSLIVATIIWFFVSGSILLETIILLRVLLLLLGNL